MAHIHPIEDAQGDLVDLVYFCSDSCNRQHSGEAYTGWYGCVELEVSNECANCGAILRGIEDN